MKDAASQLSSLSPERRALLALKLRDKSRQGGAGQPVERKARPERLPLSFAQQRLWFLDQLSPGNPAYNMPAAVRLRGALDAGALEKALTELLRRHESLRTAFRADGGEPVQVVAAPEPFRLKLIDLTGRPEGEREAEARRLAGVEARLPFDLSAGSPLRVSLLRLAADDHVALYTMHHIVSDAWSVDVMLREVAALYDAYTGGRPSPLAEPALQYADYALWQREHLRGAALEAQVDYWREHLRDAPALLELPTDRPRPAAPTHGAGRESFALPEGLAESLDELSRGEGATLFMTLLAAFKALLSRYSGQPEVVVGTPVANRPRRELEGVIGFFANTLALRTRVSGGETFRELLRGVRETALGAYAHQDLPFERLVEELRPERSLGHTPLFQVMFNFLGHGSAAGEGGAQARPTGLAMTPFELGVGRAKFDLQLAMWRDGRGLAGALEYSTDLFDAETARRLLEHFRALLTGLAAAPGQPLASHLSRIPRPGLSVAVAATFTAEPLAESLAFWARRLRMPCAIQFAPFNQVFQELLEPHSLLGSNGDGVNVILLRLCDWLPANAPDRQRLWDDARAFVSALRASASRLSTPHLVCLDSDPGASGGDGVGDLLREVKQFILDETAWLESAHCFDLSETAAAYEVARTRDAYAEEVGGVAYTAELFAAVGTALSRKIFSLRKAPHKVIVLDCDNTLWQGVCGEDGPDGVRVGPPFVALQRFMLEQREAGMLLCISSKNNDADVVEVFRRRAEMPLALDHFVMREVNWGPKSESLKRLAAALRLSLDSFIFVDDDPVVCAEVSAACPEVLTLNLPARCEDIPAFLAHAWAFDRPRLTEEDRKRSQLYRQDAERDALLKRAPSLADFLAGLELKIAVSPAAERQLARVEQLTQRTNQFNATTVRRTAAELRQLLREGAECWVAEVSDRFGDYGLVGVLIFCQEGDALKADTFLLSCRALGRGVEAEMLVKLARLARERGCRAVRVPYRRTQKNTPVREFLSGLGVRAEARGEDEWVFDFPVELLASGLPAARPSPSAAAEKGMDAGGAPSAPTRAPAARVEARAVLDAATRGRTAEGILQLIGEGMRAARPAQDAPFVAPRTPTEEITAAIWCDLMRLDRVGAHDDFFRLGGHSLLATQVVSRLHDAFRAELPLAAVFEAPTVAGLAARVEAARAGDAAPAPSPITPAPREGALPLSFQQLSMLDGASAAAVFSGPEWHMSRALRLRGTLDLGALEAAFTGLVRRHESLRACIVEDGGEPAQIAVPPSPFAVAVTDLRGLPAAAREGEVRRLAGEERRRLFDPAGGRLLRAGLLRLADDEHVLLLTMHHIAGDGWSTGVLLAELSALYNAHAGGRAPSLPEPRLHYADYAAWQRRRLTGEALDRLLSYWHGRLAGAPAELRLPLDRPRPETRDGRYLSQPLALTPELTGRLRDLCRGEGVSLFMALTSALKALLWQLTGQDDLVISTATANRAAAGAESLVGLFTQPLVLRTDLSGDPTFRELLRRVRDTALGAYSHEEAPFDLLLESLGLSPRANPAPLLQVCLAVQKAHRGALELSGLALSPVDLGGREAASRSDLELELVETEERVGGSVIYSAELFEPETVSRMVGRYVGLLEEAVAAPGRRLSDFTAAGG